MGYNEDSSLLGNGSFLTGAIFMSNRETKKECFSRKLFGLPSFQANIVKRVKTGMILFLLEYEERKLYGVFEATSDGAMDIIPTAFISSGRSFSAQVRFRVKWHCQPLREAEFFDAISENYYGHKKFHLLLSDTQVFKLLELFYLKCHSRVHKCVSKSMFPKKNGNKRIQSFKSEKYEPHLEGNRDTNTSIHGTGLNQFVHHHKRKVHNFDGAISIDGKLLQASLDQSKFPEIVYSNSQGLCAIGENASLNPQHNCSSQLVPGSHLKKSCISSGIDDASMEQLAFCSSGSGDHSFSTCQHYYPPIEQGTTLSSKHETSISSSIHDSPHQDYEINYSLTVLASRYLGEWKSINNPQQSVTRSYGSRVNFASIQYLNVSEHQTNNFEITEESLFSCTKKSMPQTLNVSDSLEHQDERSSYQLSRDDECCAVDEYHHHLVCSKLYSEIHEKRISVFSRLSCSHKTPTEVHTYDPSIDISLDELITLLKFRRKRWSKMSEIQNMQRPTMVSDLRKSISVPTLENVSEVLDKSESVYNEQLANMDQVGKQDIVLFSTEESYSEDGTSISSTLPFLNFRRRKTQNVSCATESTNPLELEKNESSLVRGKRRKLSRPSFDKVAMQNVQEIAVDPSLEVIGGELDGNVFIAPIMQNETGTGAVVENSSSPIGSTKGRLLNITVKENADAVETSSSLATHAVKPLDLNSMATKILDEDKGKSWMQELFLNHDDSLECKASGKEAKMVHLSPELHGEDAISFTSDVASKQQDVFQGVPSRSEGFHVRNFIVKIDDNKGVTDHCTSSPGGCASGEKRRHRAEYAGESTDHDCNLELSLGHQNIGIGELSYGGPLNHDEPAMKFRRLVEEGAHIKSSRCKNSKDLEESPVSKVNTHEEPIKLQRDQFDIETVNDSNDYQTGLPKIAAGVGQLPSSCSLVRHSAEPFQGAKTNIGSKKNLGLCGNERSQGNLPGRYEEGIEPEKSQARIAGTQNSVADTIDLRRKAPPGEGLDDGNKTSQLSRQLNTSGGTGTQNSLSTPCTPQAGESTAEPKDYLTSGTFSCPTCAPSPEAEITGREKQLLFVRGISWPPEAAAETTQQGKIEERVTVNPGGSRPGTSSGVSEATMHDSSLDLSLTIPPLPTPLERGRGA